MYWRTDRAPHFYVCPLVGTPLLASLYSSCSIFVYIINSSSIVDTTYQQAFTLKFKTGLSFQCTLFELVRIANHLIWHLCVPFFLFLVRIQGFQFFQFSQQ